MVAVVNTPATTAALVLGAYVRRKRTAPEVSLRDRHCLISKLPSRQAPAEPVDAVAVRSIGDDRSNVSHASPHGLD